MRASPRPGPPPARVPWRLVVLGLTVAGWLGSFAALRHLGTWAPFVAVGPGLAFLLLVRDPLSRQLLRPTLPAVGVGLLAGAVMVALTHAAFALIAPRMPQVRADTEALYRLFEIGAAFPISVRVGLLVLIAASEEVLFRGALLGGAGGPWDVMRRPRPNEWLAVAALALLYGLSTLTLGSMVLVVVAVACGAVWGALRVATGSLVPPILTHALWHLGILVLWPLVEPVA
jgi:uncharacterized protein